MTAGIVNTFAFQLVTVKSITTPNQLRGKRIGVNRFGAAPDVAARYALNHLKIDLREVTNLQFGRTIDAGLEAMKAGQLDAAILLPPITTIALKDGMNILLDMSELGGEFLITGMASSQKFDAAIVPAVAPHARLRRRHSLFQDQPTRERKNHRALHAHGQHGSGRRHLGISRPRSCRENLIRR